MELTIKEIQAIENEMVKEMVEICDRNNITYYLHCGSALGAIRHKGPIPWDTDVDVVVPYDQFNNFISAMRNELPGKFYLDYYDTNKNYPSLFPRIALKGFSSFRLHIDIFRLIGISSIKAEQEKLLKKTDRISEVYSIKKGLKIYRAEIISGMKFKIKKLLSSLKKILLKPLPGKLLTKKFDSLCNTYPFNNAEYVTNPSGHYGIKNVLKKSVYGKGLLVDYSGIQVRIPEQYDYYLKHYYGDYMQYPPEQARKLKNSYLIKEL